MKCSWIGIVAVHRLKPERGEEPAVLASVISFLECLLDGLPSLDLLRWFLEGLTAYHTLQRLEL